ncbi:hypothetical protein AVEN_49733-1 [Araneus ventricosus]|uniref:Uncharacterized protein n=1 Tax=Araneus ventricosus TaxID=182803 RepID=A0A4Y2FEF5_ARAVE|nr:hypothetical protein AVEN_49733-1 [Araneus ventricosus]
MFVTIRSSREEISFEEGEPDSKCMSDESMPLDALLMKKNHRLLYKTTGSKTTSPGTPLLNGSQWTSLPTKVNVAFRPSNPRFVMSTSRHVGDIANQRFLRSPWSCLVSSKYRRLCGCFGASAPPCFVIPHLHWEALSFLGRLTLAEE